MQRSRRLAHLFGTGAALLFIMFPGCSGQISRREAPPATASAPAPLPSHSSWEVSPLSAVELTRPLLHPSAAFALGQVAWGARRYEQAAAWFERAVQLDATNAEYHLWLGRAYGRQARLAGASEQFFLARKVRRHLEKAVELNPNHIAARLDLMEYYLQAPSLLGGGLGKAHLQAAAIADRDARQGDLAWQRCRQAETRARLLEITGPAE